MSKLKHRDPREFFILLILLGLFVGGWQLERRHAGRQGEMIRAHVFGSKEVLRVLAPKQERVTATISPYGKGFERELLESFARGAGYNLEWQTSSEPGEALRALLQGRADIVIGQNGTLPPELKDVAAGPAYAHYRPVLVEARKPTASDHVLARHVLLQANLPLEKRLPKLLPDLQPTSLTRVPPRFGLSTLLNSLHARTAPMAVMSDARFRLWQPFYLNLHPAGTLPEEIPWRWFWRTDDKRFAEAMDSFWNYHETETRLAELTERYFGFFPAETPYYELETLYRTLESELPKYAPAIVEHCSGQGINPLLFAALIYQESGFDPLAKSHTGAKGLLQFTKVTARHFNLQDRRDPLDSIRAGCAYLGLLHERLEVLDLAPWDRWFFALAAYNQGLGGLRDAIDLAQRLGLSGRTWRELKMVFPLLEQEQYAALAEHGFCRGTEVVRFVDNVRYYFYILNGVVRLSRPEAQYLGPLLDGLAGGSFAGGAPLAAPRPLS